MEQRATTSGTLAAVLGLGPNVPAALARHGAREEARENWIAAAEAHRAATMLAPGLRSSWIALARCLEHIGDRERARMAREKAA